MVVNQVKQEQVSATKWSVLTELLSKLVTPITNMILARLLLPQAFGVIATISLITSFGDMLTDAGLQKFLIHKEFEDSNELETYANVAFWTNFLISSLLWVSILLNRDAIARLLGNAGLGSVVSIACFQIVLTSFSSIQFTLAKRKFDFKSLFIVKGASIFVPLFIAIPLAYNGYGYWALIFSNLVKHLINVLVMIVLFDWKPKLQFSFKALRAMYKFSLWSFLESFAIWFTVWADVLIVSSYLTAHHLGLYKTATMMVNSIMGIITASILPVLFSTLSRLQSNQIEFKRVYQDTIRIVSIVTLPLGVGLFVFRELATVLILGEQWSGASIVIGNWGITSSLSIVFGYFASEVYRSMGKPRLSFIAQLLHLIVLIPVCIIGAEMEFKYFVFLRSWVRLEMVVIHIFFMVKFFGFSIRKLLVQLRPMLISSLVMGVIGAYLLSMRTELWWSFVSVIICFCIYFLVLYQFSSIRVQCFDKLKNNFEK